MSFPFTLSRRVLSGAVPPPAADVVVVGGGVIGVMTALFLARAGVRVVLLEKGRVAAEQSSRNWGWIRAQGRDPAELPIAMEARRLWSDIAADLDEDIGLRTTGVTYLAPDARRMDSYVRWQAVASAQGLDCEVLDAGDVAAMLPGAGQRWAGAIRTPSDLRAEPSLAVPAVARRAIAAGAVICEGCAVRGLDVAGGRIAGVLTERGRVVASEVVVAGGAWSRLLLQRHGIAIPQLSVRSTALATEPMPQMFDGAAVDDRLAFRRRMDGGYTLAPSAAQELYVGRDAVASLGAYLPQLRADPLGTRLLPAAPSGFPDAWATPRRWSGDSASPFEAVRVLNPAPNRRRVAATLAAFAATFPQAGPVRARVAWAGMIDTMPDIVPVVDRAESLPGLTIATGMSGHGFGIGPAFGRIAAALVTGGAVGHDMHRFRLSRFSDGSRVELGPLV